MTNGTGGPNLYTIDTCSEVRAISKILTGGTGILRIPRCLLGVVLEPEANNTHLGMTFFFTGAARPPDVWRVSNHYHCPVSMLYWILRGYGQGN